MVSFEQICCSRHKLAIGAPTIPRYFETHRTQWIDRNISWIAKIGHESSTSKDGRHSRYCCSVGWERGWHTRGCERCRSQVGIDCSDHAGGLTVDGSAKGIAEIRDFYDETGQRLNALGANARRIRLSSSVLHSIFSQPAIDRENVGFSQTQVMLERLMHEAGGASPRGMHVC